jgi:hypothetical protein
MKSKIERKTARVSFRVTPTEKKNLNDIIELLNTNTFDFFRKKIITILLSTVFKNNKDEQKSI